ncbi:hypothetical protein AtDm6_1467 [Acetobacter tropicalis]|uniref:Uncharacterized protein n=1 Tax=Acetobacter tropicalis TaxID=104102 RepID=A0A094ZP78_9PROT|nr:hypothetical protein AtDm6_1467 [Acetobacter tropicalis]
MSRDLLRRFDGRCLLSWSGRQGRPLWIGRVAAFGGVEATLDG